MAGAPPIEDLEYLLSATALAADPRPGTRPLDATSLDVLGIELLVVTPERVVARMPGDIAARPGTMLVLAESAASTAAGTRVGPDRRAFGAELNAATLGQPTTSGPVIADARALRVDDSLHTWSITVIDDAGVRLLEARCTLGIVDAPTPKPIPA
ncbi:MAG: thioesterase superfamily protein [Thermoleophilia bacterium]|nr:thioesterase superfamily protein [Thermoleophilia bacterium]MCZ4497034.1 thioesterase superfamily protein [Thermoleophilia bacterium]